MEQENEVLYEKSYLEALHKELEGWQKVANDMFQYFTKTKSELKEMINNGLDESILSEEEIKDVLPDYQRYFDEANKLITKSMELSTNLKFQKEGMESHLKKQLDEMDNIIDDFCSPNKLF